jgi:hypothetical protein
MLKNIDIKGLVEKADAAALVEGKRYFEEVMGGRDYDACGFVNLVVWPSHAKGNVVKDLLANGFFKTTWFGKTCYMRSFRHGQKTQGMCCTEAVTEVAKKLFIEAGFPDEALGIYRQMH